MTHRRNDLVVLGMILLLVGMLMSCARQKEADLGRSKETVRQIGSTTVLPLAEKWRKAYNAKHPEVSIAVSGGGSGTGIEALLAGTAEIANSSRDIKPEEIERAKGKGVTPVEHLVAYDGIAVIVHPSNPLEALSVEQLSDIYTGKVKDWDAVGAKGLGAIQVVSRDSSSGTYESFKELVVTLGGKDKSRDYAPEALKQASNEAILSLVSQTKGAIGYVGLGYLSPKVKALKVIPVGGGEAVAPSAASVLDGSYPIARKLYCYTNGEPRGAVKAYLDWIKGPEGQAIVRELGFVPVPH